MRAAGRPAQIATWIRERDHDYFARFFPRDCGVELQNARTGGLDLGGTEGLLLSGGPDISAEFLRQEDIDRSLIEDAEPDRDAWEFAALEEALAAGKPIFAICKGLQVLNVGLGGSLHLDVPGHRDPEMKTGNLQPLRSAMGVECRFPFVNSSHHQALDRLGAGLEVEAWSARDGIVEQVRHRGSGGAFILGVQYHPERDMLYQSLFEEFIRHVRG